MQLTKPELRQQLKAQRLALTDAERRAKSQAIIARLPGVINWSDVTNLHCFESIGSLGEASVLNAFIASTEGEHAVQYTDKIYIEVKSIYTDKKIDGNWQTVALEGDAPIPAKYDVIIVPMLGFDDGLHRIGYGGGFYDKFLAVQPDACKIGVCFDLGKVDQIPTEPHDIPLDLIVTETAVYPE